MTKLVQKIEGHPAAPIRRDLHFSLRQATGNALASWFNIHKNRSLKIKDKRLGMWFVDAVNQFDDFSQLTCPFCSNDLKASEARLFGIFKLPYSIIGISVVFIIILFALIFHIMP